MPDSALQVTVTVGGSSEAVLDFITRLDELVPSLVAYPRARAAHSGSIQDGLLVVQLRPCVPLPDANVIDLEWALYQDMLMLLDIARGSRFPLWIRPRKRCLDGDDDSL